MIRTRGVCHMPFLYIGSTGDHAGHSLITWAIARRLVEKDIRVGFFKPFGTHPTRAKGFWADRDVLLFKDVLNLEDPLDRICPYLDSEKTWRQKTADEILNDLKSLAEELLTGKDILIIMGSKHLFLDDASYPVTDISLTAELKADFVFINRYRDSSKSIYSILSVNSMLKERVKGIILNRVPPEKLQEIKDTLIPSFAKRGIPITAALPEDPALSFRSLREIVEVLNGDVLWGTKILEQPVGGMTVGSLELTGELHLFKRVYNKLILLKPSSPDTDIENPAVHRSIAGIVLTGGRNPAPQVLHAAKNAGIPLLLVKSDTFSALERLEEIAPALSPKDEAKVRCFIKLMDSDGALDRLLRSLGFVA
jgi:BioD-like phosphotransacetylase family protein